MTRRAKQMEAVARTDDLAPVVEGRGLVRVYRDGDNLVHALREVDISVGAGEFVAITGPSGSGKSTLLHVLGGLDRPDEGEVRFNGEALVAKSDNELALFRRRQVGLVLQFFNLLPTLSAVENAAFPLLLDGRADAFEIAQAALAQVGLADRAHHVPSKLSGGEQQRVAIARAISTHPTLILADEPTGNLDSGTGEEILSILRGAADTGQSIVMVTHDARCAAFADRILRIVDGRIVGSAGGRNDGVPS